MHVVVVESPAKAKTINKYLGSGYQVVASYGHVRDLPAKSGSVRPDESFAMDWEIDPKSEKRLKVIRDALKSADGLYLAHLLWPHSPDEYLVMRELGDPDIYARKGKHFFPARYEPSMEPWPVERHLPQTLEEGVPAVVPMTVGDNLDAQRDWGYAGDYVDAMWRMLQADEADDYVVSTNETHSVREYLDIAFTHVGIDDWEKHVYQDPAFFRPAEVDLLIGDSTKARETLGWKPEVDFPTLVKMMVDADVARVAAGEA